jgi:hypothetical protein
MGHIATLYPSISQRRLPLSRDQLMLLLAAVNLLFLGLDTYLAHLVSGTIVPREYIPIYFGVVSGVILLLAGLIALRNRRMAVILATLVFVSSILVGFIGAYFHVLRAALPNAPIGSRLSVNLLIWAPPVIAPLTFALVGLWGMSASLVEDPAGSGILRILGKYRLRLPYSKTRAYLLMVSLGILATLLSSVLDHARDEFRNPWVWIPLIAGVFGTVVPAVLAGIQKPTRTDVTIYIGTMLMLIVVGVIGTVLHVQADLVSQRVIVVERFIRGAPFLAPLLFANMGMFGLIVLASPEERRS